MLEGMLAKGDAEMKHEQVVFAEFSQFCQGTSTDKQREIAEAEETIEELSANIEKATAAKAQAHDKQLLHDTDVFHWTGDIKASTNVRALDKGTFDKTHADYSESVDALNRAVNVLSDAAHDTPQALVQLQSLKLVPLEAKQQLAEFLQRSKEEPTVPEIAAYTFNSHGVLEMLKKLAVKFTDELRVIENEERDAVQNHQLLVQSLSAAIKQAKAQSASAVAKQNSLTEKVSADTAARDENVAVRDAATKYLADLTSTCEQKSSDFKSRQALRADELQALQKAIAVLEGDVAPIAAKHLPHDVPAEGSALAQLFLKSGEPSQQRMVQFLESQAGRLNSRVLSAVALRAAKDPFTKVKKMIEDLIARLQSEAGEEADHHSWCNSELAVNEQTRKQKTTSAESLHTKIDVLQVSIADRTQQIKELNNATASLVPIWRRLGKSGLPNMRRTRNKLWTPLVRSKPLPKRSTFWRNFTTRRVRQPSSLRTSQQSRRYSKIHTKECKVRTVVSLVCCRRSLLISLASRQKQQHPRRKRSKSSCLSRRILKL
jgi:hypothetical protein